MPYLKIPSVLKSYTGGETRFKLHGSTIHEMLDDLGKVYPELKPHLLNRKGELAAFVHLFLNEEDTRDKQGLATPIGEEDEVILVPSIAGGTDA
jgi:adenylyltransferase/sulfurtransferase